jgi:hypothetical protein
MLLQYKRYKKSKRETKTETQKLYNTEVTVIYSRRAEGICEKKLRIKQSDCATITPSGIKSRKLVSYHEQKDGRLKIDLS